MPVPPPRAPADRTKGRARALFVVGVVALLVTAVVVVVVTHHPKHHDAVRAGHGQTVFSTSPPTTAGHPATNVRPTTPPSTAPPTTAGTTVAPGPLTPTQFGHVLDDAPAKLGSGWTEVQAFGPAPSAGGTGCYGAGVAVGLSLDHAEEYSYMLQPNGGESGHAVIDSKLYDNPQDAAASITARTASGWSTCFGDGVQEQMAQASGDPNAKLDSLTRQTPPPTDGVGWTAVTSYTFQGVARSETEDEVFMRVGRIVVDIDVQRCCQAWPAAGETTVLASLAGAATSVQGLPPSKEIEAQAAGPVLTAG